MDINEIANTIYNKTLDMDANDYFGTLYNYYNKITNITKM